MKTCLSFKHLIVVFGSVISFASTSHAQSLCRDLLRLPPSTAQVEITLDALATMKLRIDEEKGNGNTSILQKQQTQKFVEKKIEIQQALNLSEKELIANLKERIARKQDRQAEEQQKEARARQQEQMVRKEWKFLKTVELNTTHVATQDKWISEKHQVAIQQISQFQQDLYYIDLKNGQSKPLSPPQGLVYDSPIIPKNADIAILRVDLQYHTLDLTKGSFSEWTAINDWIASKNPSQIFASTLSPDNSQLLVAVKDKNFRNSYAIVDVSTGNIVRDSQFTSELDYKHITWVGNDHAFFYGDKNSFLHSFSGGWTSGVGLGTVKPFITIENESAIVGVTKDRKLFRLQLGTRNKIESREATASIIGADAEYIWAISPERFLQKFRIGDLTLASVERNEVANNARLIPTEEKSLLAQNLPSLKAGYFDARDMSNPTFTFKDKYAADNIEVASTIYLPDSKKVLIQWKNQYQQDFFDIWETPAQ